MTTTPKPVQLAKKLPRKTDNNGLSTVHEQLKRHGDGYLVARVEAPRVTDHLGGVKEPIAEIQWVEGLPAGPLQQAAELLLEWARAARLGDDEGALIKRADLINVIRSGRDLDDDLPV